MSVIGIILIRNWRFGPDLAAKKKKKKKNLPLKNLPKNPPKNQPKS